ncbi:hypothetical protein KA977_09520 [Candidatus Dependentiae bacterium]|nr:hypothetical protein [Candidatus Dependentiae bacterium]
MLVCYKCKNFQIRYNDHIHKYGCKALGFKSPDSNWYWLHMPCPYFEENPKRNNKIKKNDSADEKQTEIKSDFSNNNNKINIIV